MNTEKIIQKCKNNDYKAQITVYNLYKNLLFNSSFRILKRREDAEDVVQDSFIQGFKKIHQLQNDGNIGAWFRRIAINKSYDIFRKQNKIVWLEDEQIYELEEELELTETLNISIDFVKKCISNLKEKYRIIVVLYMIEDYSHKEIGTMLNINESTVRNQYKRGKDQLIVMLTKDKK